MCLILFAYKSHPAYPLVLAANRDEAYVRATEAARFWQDQPHIYGGRDLEQGGTWLGLTRTGRMAAVTNFRDGYAQKKDTRSRGGLTVDFLCGSLTPARYTERVRSESQAYNGFNLLVGDLDELHYIANRPATATVISPGIHGLSNHLLDTPWPKVEQGKAVLKTLLDRNSQDMVDPLFSLLADRTTVVDASLPDTGIGLSRERVLSPAFIVSPTYGTRSSTVILVDNHGQVLFIERSFGVRGKTLQTVTGRFTLEAMSLAT